MTQSFERLDEFIMSKMSATHLPAVSLAVIAGDQVVHSRGFGQRNRETGLPATPATLYCIGSVTKSFTALAIMQLQERGLLSVNDEVSRHLDIDLRAMDQPVLIRHLLSHTSGIPALAYAEAVIRRAMNKGGPDLPMGSYQDMFTFLRGAGAWAHYPPGRHHFYFNEGYVLLGAVIEQVSGLTYQEYVKQNILQPLGMERTFFDRREVEADHDAAQPYIVEGDGKRTPGRYLYGAVTSDGGLISSVADMTRYVRMYLDDGRGQEGRLIEPSSLAAMTEAHVEVPRQPFLSPSEDGRLRAELGDPAPSNYYGFGLGVIPDFMGHRLIQHGGSVGVATAHMAFIPDRRLGIVLLANGSGYSLLQLAHYGLALALGQEPDDLLFRRSEMALERLEGVYETFRGTMCFVVRRRADFLAVEDPETPQADPTMFIPLEYGPDGGRFVALGAGNRVLVEFVEGPEGMELVWERYKFRRVGPCGG